MRLSSAVLIGVLVAGPVVAEERDFKTAMDVITGEGEPGSAADIPEDKLLDGFADFVKKQEEKQGYTNIERLKKMQEASSELIGEEVVNVNEEFIRLRTADFTKPQTFEMVQHALAELTQCGVFRRAQAVSLRNRGSETSAYDKKVNYLESHLFLFGEAAERVSGDPTIRATIRTEFEKNSGTWFAKHYDSMTYKTDAQKSHYTFWDDRCDTLQNNLETKLEARARDNVSIKDIEARTDELLAELVASRQ